MSAPVQITVRHMARSDPLTARIRADADKLSEFYPRIISCRVVVERRDLHKHRGQTYNVRLTLKVPKEEIVVTHDHHEDVYVAVRDAFASATRRLEDYARQLRGEVKAHSLAVGGKTGRVEE
jgi:ribosome-associated translation inhibitor RaiA